MNVEKSFHLFYNVFDSSLLSTGPWEEDLSYAEAVVSSIKSVDNKIELETVSLQKEYWNEVVSYTLREAKEGHTPNPDIM